MLFWSFVTTTLVFLTFGLVCIACLRIRRKEVVFGVPLLFLGFGELKVLLTDAIACE